MTRQSEEMVDEKFRLFLPGAGHHVGVERFEFTHGAPEGRDVGLKSLSLHHDSPTYHIVLFENFQIDV